VTRSVEAVHDGIRATLRDPVLFARRALRHRTWWTQERLLRAPLHHDRIAVKACHKSSKTFSVAELVLWWLVRYPDGKVVTTSPNFRQVKRNLWSEIGTMARTCRIALPEPNQTELTLGRKNWAIGVATSRDVDFAGFSGRILVIIDEAPGVGDAIFDALKGVRAGGRVTVVMLGNPIILGGPYHEAFTKGRGRWHTITINAFDTPNVRPLLGGLDPHDTADEVLVKALSEHTERDFAEAVIFPDLVRAEWILEMWEDEGPGTLDWEARVMGRFPSVGLDTIVDKIDRVEAARKDRRVEPGPVQIGIDVARGGGDETAVCVRRGDTVLEIDGTRKGFPSNAGFVKNRIRSWKDREGWGVESVKVDSAGDHSIFDQLRAQEYAFPVHGINVGENPWGKNRSERRKARERYFNLKAQLWANLRQRARDGRLRGVDDDEALAQLSAVRKETWHDGSMRVEKKASLESRGVGSPDRAEAVMLAFAEPPDRGGSLKDLEPARRG